MRSPHNVAVKPLRHPVLLFLGIGVLVLIFIALGTAWLSTHIAESQIPNGPGIRDDIAVAIRRRELTRAFRPVTIGGLVVFLVATTPIVWTLTRRLERTAEEKERLGELALDASDAERRRIARDLHDGVVQDLAAATFSLEAAARDPALSGQVAADIATQTSALRGALRSLRSLLVEIHPPDLSPASLQAALQDLLATAESTGVQTSLQVTGSSLLSQTQAALIWRVAQESVRNALRHGSPHRIDVQVSAARAAAELVVRDDGVGFDPAAVRGSEHFGLRGLASLVRDTGGELAVASRPGVGATITLRMPS